MTTPTPPTKWIWDKYGKDVTDGFLSFAKRWYQERERSSPKLQSITRAWMKFNWANAAERYQQHIQELCGQLIVPGVGSVDLDEIFTDVFIIDNPTLNRYVNYQRGEEPKFDESKRISGLRLLTQERGHRLFIWGEPGAGKTTFLKHIVQRTAQNHIHKIPIFVSLNEWEISKKELLDFIAEQFEICDFPDAEPFIQFILREGDVILLFDGLDEVSVENRERIAKELNKFARSAGVKNSQCMITCRIEGTQYVQEDFTNVQIAPFDETRISNFVQKRLQDSGKANKFLDDLKKPENNHLASFSKNPLLLSLMCMVFEPNQEFPKRKADLYKEATRYLLTEWLNMRGIEKNDIAKMLSKKQVEWLYGEIAFQTFEEGVFYFNQEKIEEIIKKFLEKIFNKDISENIETYDVLTALITQHGIITRRSKRIFSFAHLTFHEYYTARYIIDNESSAVDKLVINIKDTRWKEIFLLTATLMGQTDLLIINMEKEIVSMLQGEETLAKIIRWVNKKASSVPGVEVGSARGFYWLITLYTTSDHFYQSSDRISFRDLTYFISDPYMPISVGEDIDQHILEFFSDDNFQAYSTTRNIILPRAVIKDIKNGGPLVTFIQKIYFSEVYQIIRILNFIVISCPEYYSELLFTDQYLIRSGAIKRVEKFYYDLKELLYDFPFLSFDGKEEIDPIVYKSILPIMLDSIVINLLLICEYPKLLRSEYSYRNFFMCYERVLGIAYEISPQLASQIKNVNLPGRYDLNDREKWLSFRKKIFTILNISDEVFYGFEWNQNHLELLRDYYLSTELLIECLDFAKVDDPKAILSNILPVE